MELSSPLATLFAPSMSVHTSSASSALSSGGPESSPRSFDHHHHHLETITSSIANSSGTTTTTTYEHHDDNNNNKHILVASSDDKIGDYKALYGQMINNNNNNNNNNNDLQHHQLLVHSQISNETKNETVKILLGSSDTEHIKQEMPDAVKQINNSASVATMLNINGTNHENGQANGQNGLQSIYDYYKLPMVVDGGNKGITLITADGKTVTAEDALQDMVWSVPVSAVSSSNVLQNVSSSNGSLSSSPPTNHQHSDEEHSSSTTTSPLNGHMSPKNLIKLEKSVVTQLIASQQQSNDNNNNGDHNGQNGQSMLQADQIMLEQHSGDVVHIKNEPMDTLTDLSSSQVVDVIQQQQQQQQQQQPNHLDRNRELEPSPPTTVISLAPAQPYPANPGAGPTTASLSFAAPAYDLSGNGAYVQVNAAQIPQYAPVSAAQQAATRTTNGGTVYLTTADYLTYPTTTNNNNNNANYITLTNGMVVSSDQYHTVRQHLTTQPNVVSATSYATNETDVSYLDRYLRQQQQQQPITTTAIAATLSTVSPTAAVAITAIQAANDSGIGDASAAPRPDNSALAQQIFEYASLQTPTQALLPGNGSGELTPVGIASVAPSLTSPQVSNGSSTPGTPASATKSASRRSWHEYGRNSDIDKIQIAKLFSDIGFKYFLESPISTSQRREDDRVTYINKGQFYGITLEYNIDADKPLKNATVKTVVMLVFREEKTQDEEVKAWQFWHSRQHSVKQRILDADTKNSSGIVGPIEEVAHNAIAFFWNPLEGQAKVNIAVQCLSTDFSNQKGVKGLPLHLQVDTFDDIREASTPVHRGYCQIKVFCDKGAERKTRDEERRAAKRKLNATGNGRKKIEEMYHPTMERSEFYSMADLIKPPVLFTPSDDIDKITTGDINFYGHGGGVSADLGYGPETGAIVGPTPIITTSLPISALQHCERTDSLLDLPVACPPKKMKLERYPSLNERVLLYAKQENEDVFHPLHLVPPTLVGLALAIENKYKLEAKNIRNIYRRCKNGITVQMDDDMVKHYSHEDTVLLEVHQIDNETHDITLVEYDS